MSEVNKKYELTDFLICFYAPAKSPVTKALLL